MFATMVAATEQNLADTGGDPVDTFVEDAVYWSIDSATLDIDADVLITPMQRRHRTPRPLRPHRDQRQAAADEMGVPTAAVRKLLGNHRSGRPDPVELRRAMVERLATDDGAAAYAKRKTTVEAVLSTRTPGPLHTDSEVPPASRNVPVG